MQNDPLNNVDAGILGMYAAVKIFTHNGIDPHRMVNAIADVAAIPTGHALFNAQALCTMTPMTLRIKLPSDLPSDPAEAYRRGWHDRAAKSAAKAGRTITAAKSAASAANGKKGGRPRKSPAPEGQG